MLFWRLRSKVVMPVFAVGVQILISAGVVISTSKMLISKLSVLKQSALSMLSTRIKIVSEVLAGR